MNKKDNCYKCYKKIEGTKYAKHGIGNACRDCIFPIFKKPEPPQPRGYYRKDDSLAPEVKGGKFSEEKEENSQTEDDNNKQNDGE